jgi:hypothetical protein
MHPLTGPQTHSLRKPAQRDSTRQKQKQQRPVCRQARPGHRRACRGALELICRQRVAARQSLAAAWMRVRAVIAEARGEARSGRVAQIEDVALASHVVTGEQAPIQRHDVVRVLRHLRTRANGKRGDQTAEDGEKVARYRWRRWHRRRWVAGFHRPGAEAMAALGGRCGCQQTEREYDRASRGITRALGPREHVGEGRRGPGFALSQGAVRACITQAARTSRSCLRAAIICACKPRKLCRFALTANRASARFPPTGIVP